MTASMEFVNLLHNATRKFTDYLIEHDKDSTHGYIVIGIENGDCQDMTSCSNIPPEQMYMVLALLVANTTVRDVSEETQTH